MTEPVALAQYRRRAARYDAELALFEPLRVAAIRRLALQPGETVLDLGCGTGLSFAALREQVGAQGRVVAIEQSPEMAARAAQRIARAGWDNIELHTAPVAAARLRGHADAALFHFTHDIVRDEASLANVFAHLKPGARVVASGLQWAPAWMLPVNAFVLGAAWYSVSMLEGLARPWDRLAPRLARWHVERVLGGFYIAHGFA